MDRRGGFLALFTSNRYCRLPAPCSPESDSSDDEEAPTQSPTSAITPTSSAAGTSVNTRYNVSPVSWASISPTLVLSGSNLGNPSNNPPQQDDSSKGISDPSQQDDSSKGTTTAGVPLGAMVAIPGVVGSSSLMEQSSITIANPAAIPVVTGSSSLMEQSTTIANPAVSSIRTVVATGSTTQPTPSDVKLTVLSYGDVKSNLPPIESLIQPEKVADSTVTTSATSSVGGDFSKTLLTLAQEASKMYVLSGDGASINAGFPAVDGQNIVTTITYSLGGSGIGNLSPRGQQMSWLHQSAKEALETARSWPYPSARGRGCSARKRSSCEKAGGKTKYPAN